MIYIVSSKKAALERALAANAKKTWAVMLSEIPRNTDALSIQPEDQIYLDISGFPPAELKKAIGSFKKFCAACFWGVIDPKGAAEDPAAFFFAGSFDYIGPGLFKKGLNKKRFTAALLWAQKEKEPGEAEAGRQVKGSGSKGTAENEADSGAEKKSPALEAGQFQGWKSVRAGTPSPFLFLYVSLSGKSDLRSQVGESIFAAVKNRLRDVLQQGLYETDALLWMEMEDSSLYLIPPNLASGRAAVESCLKMIFNSCFVNVEKLGISVPVNFTFALHYGETIFRMPGKTGAVISESVNYIFHLGVKKAEPGRLTVSGAVPDEALPEGLLDIFKPAGLFEGIPVRHSRRFVYK